MSILKVANVHFESTGSNFIDYPDTNTLRIVVNSVEDLRITPSGNVGIGTTTPSYRLDVAGTINASNMLVNGAPLTSGASLTVDAVNASRFLTFANNTTGTFTQANVSASLTFNPSTNVFSSQFSSVTGALGVGTAPSATTGEIRATNNITAYYSDRRLKTVISYIPDALAKVKALSGVIYVNNEVAESFGYTDKSEQVGVIAQEVEAVLPQVVKLAPFDTEYVNGVETSRSGDNYRTVQYDKIIPLLIEAIKELSAEVEKLKNKP